MEGLLIENLVKVVENLKSEAIELRNQARDSLIIGNKQVAGSYLRYSGIFNVAANDLRKIYLGLIAYGFKI